MKGFKEVTKEEFQDFVRNYPNKLEWNVSGACDPPLGSYNDFTLGNWSESVVAKVFLMDGSDYYGGRTNEYYIKVTE